MGSRREAQQVAAAARDAEALAWALDLGEVLDRGAVFSLDRQHRYTLTRTFDPLFAEPRQQLRSVLFVGMNPSTATETDNDPTVRRMIGYARAWEYERLLVANVHPFRSTAPIGLLAAPGDPEVAATNLAYIAALDREADLTIASWGAFLYTDPDLRQRVRDVSAVLREPHVLGLTAKGYPRHPLYLRRDAEPTRWTPS